MTLAPAAPWHGLRGGLLVIAGLTILIQLPRAQVPRLSAGLAIAFMLMACMVLLPASWFPIPQWRELLSAHGLPLGSCITAHPLQTIECLSGVAVCLIVMLYLTGHRVDHGSNHVLGMVFAVGVALVALFAIGAQENHWVIPWDTEDSFGFFANRNHMATLLVMGAMTGVGVVAQSLRVRTWGSGLLALSSVFVCVWALIGYSESRAGVLLLAGVFTAWLLVLGRDYLRGRVLIAAGLLAGAALIYYTTKESAVKKRLDETADHLTFIAGSGGGNEPLWEGKTGSDSLQSLDLRLPIFLDTLGMLRHAPWTGVGAGQFQYVFPQYRERSAVANDSRSLHPESDWLLMAAEAGIPATVLLAALAAVIGGSALYRVLRGRARALRTGCLLAAAVVPVHGLFDVPGHRMELVWPACWLLAITLRGSKETPPASRLSRFVFRALGLGVIAAGALLIHAQWFAERTPAMLVSPKTVEKVGALFAAEMAEQKAAEGGAPVVAGTEDRLEKAISLLDDALKVTPMDPHLHYLKGAISLYFEDKVAEVDRAFEMALLLDPTWVAMPLMQAASWAPIDAARTERLWAEAMKRAAALEHIDPATPHDRMATFAHIMNDSRAVPGSIPHAIRAAGNDETLVKDWASHIQPEALDSMMPDILPSELSEVQRGVLFQIWYTRGAKAKAEAYAHSFHPKLLETVKPPAE